MKHASLKIKWFSQVFVLPKISQGGSERLFVYVYAFQVISEKTHNVTKKFDGSLKYNFSVSCIIPETWKSQ